MPATVAAAPDERPTAAEADRTLRVPWAAAPAPRAARRDPRRPGGAWQAPRPRRRPPRRRGRRRARRGRPQGAGARCAWSGRGAVGAGPPAEPGRRWRPGAASRRRGGRAPLRGWRDRAGAEPARGGGRRVAAWAGAGLRAGTPRLGARARGELPRTQPRRASTEARTRPGG